METDRGAVRIHATLEVSPEALQTIVAQAKALVGPDARGRFRVDTADLVGVLISRFLRVKDFEGYVADPANYPPLADAG